MKDPTIIAQLSLISAEAKLLEIKYKENRLWEGDLAQGLIMLQAKIDEARKVAAREGEL